MTQMDLAPTAIAVQPPERGRGAGERGEAGSRRVRRALACSVLLSSTLLAGWTANAQPERPRASAAKAPPRTVAARSSPPSYAVLGKHYRVLASSEGYRESGVASWYGHPFDGRPTSSGEMYDMHEMTAAHRTLPLPTWAEVTNLSNGKRVIVKINDRGPFVGKRVIDLSYAAAAELDMVRDGTANVEVRALSAPPETPARAPARERSAAAPKPQPGPPQHAAAPKPQPGPPQQAAEPKPPADSERLFAEAGKFTRRADAVELVDGLRAQGFVNAFVVTEDGRRQSSHRVRVGPLPDAAEVHAMNARLRELGARRSHSVAMR